VASYGWSYLTVVHGRESATWQSSDASAFASEEEMFRELGVTGWELVTIREAAGSLHYYFKRSRA